MMIQVGSVDGFVKEINKLANKEYFYRGENRWFPFRSPSIYQEKNLLANSSIYYSRLLAELPNHDDKTPFEVLSRLQHYGAKTRMLDITSNPLVALFFASEEDNEDGYVYVYQSDNLKFETGHTAIMKAAINFIPNKIIRDFLENENDKVLENLFLTKLNEEVNIGEKIYNNPQKIRDDLKKAHIIIAKKKTSRISRQNGNFILPAFELGADCVNQSIDNLSALDENSPIVFKIPKLVKQTILKDLATLGIHEGSVYPDVENHTKYLIRFFSGFPPKIDNTRNNDLKQEITDQYKNENIIFSGINLYGTEYDPYTDNIYAIEFLKRFHTQDASLITEDDNYFVGMRANHFIVEIGYSENPFGEDNIEQKYAIITANHKGNRLVTGIRLNGEYSIN